MESLEFKKICEAMYKLYEKYDSSYEKIIELKASGVLDDYFLENEISQNFKKILRDFLDKLSDPRYNNHHFTRKIILYNDNKLIDCFMRFKYGLSAYFNENKNLTPENHKAWLLFPRFIKEACKKYNIEPYASMDENEILNIIKPFVDLEIGYNPNKRSDRDHGEFEIQVIPHRVIDPKKYEEYDESTTKTTPFRYLGFDQATKYMSIDAEERVYSMGYYLNRGSFLWVAKYIGDGYGFDVLNINPREERLIEVKSSKRNDYFDLTDNEYNVMVSTNNYPNSYYYVYKFLYGDNIEDFEAKLYVYDKKNNALVDIYDKDNVCEIECVQTDKEVFYRCTPKKLQKAKTLIK